MLSLEGFARATGLSRSLVAQRTLPGTYMMDRESVRKIAEFRRMPPERLAEMIGANGDSPSPALPAGIGDVVNGLIEIPEWTIDLRASPWAQVQFAQLDTDDPDQAAVLKLGRFRLQILGSSMSPEYPSGSIVEFELVRVAHDPLEIGADYAVCRADGTATFKVLAAFNADTITLRAINQKKYPGEMSVPRQEIVRMAVVAHRLSPRRAPKVPKSRKP